MKYEALEAFCDEKNIDYKKNEPMSEHTSFKIGGPAQYFITPQKTEELCLLIKKLNELEIPKFILGKGSNLLVSDKGIIGAVICLSKLDNITVSGEEITAQAGASLAAVCILARQNSLEGMEFAYGIPGCVGGALYMNAGAYGGELSQITLRAKCIDAFGEETELSCEEMALGYRKSIFQQTGKIITEVTFKLKSGNAEDIAAKMDDFMNRRKSKQPLEFPSAGSTFKRPEGNFAGALIEKNGLKGKQIGGARVSEKHAGFLINADNASCKDVLELIEFVKQTVLKADGVLLQPEVILVGIKE